MLQSSQLPSDTTDPVFTPAQQEWIRQLIQAAQPPPPPPADEGTANQHQPTTTTVTTTKTAGTSSLGNLDNSTGIVSQSNHMHLALSTHL